MLSVEFWDATVIFGLVLKKIKSPWDCVGHIEKELILKLHYFKVQGMQ